MSLEFLLKNCPLALAGRLAITFFLKRKTGMSTLAKTII